MDIARNALAGPGRQGHDLNRCGEKHNTLMPLSAERELWARALQVLRQHGDKAHLHITERVGTLALAGDERAVGTWTAIAASMDRFGTRLLRLPTDILADASCYTQLGRARQSNRRRGAPLIFGKQV